MTRIVAGRVGGRRLEVPARGTRPTTDRVRESLFNVLAARLAFTGTTALDLYAGSGALGLEALSRGAAAADFVESDHRAAATIARNAAALGLPAARVHRRPVSAFLAGAATRPVDLVFADPPYDTPEAEVEAMLAGLARGGWTRGRCDGAVPGPGTVVIVERRSSSPATGWPAGWHGWPSRRYGDTRLDIAEAAAPGLLASPR